MLALCSYPRYPWLVPRRRRVKQRWWLGRGRAIGFRRDWLIVWAAGGRETLMDAPLGQKGCGGVAEDDQAPW